MREWLIINALGVIFDGAEPVCIAARNNLFDDNLRRVEILRLRQDLRHVGAILFLRDVQAGGNDGPVKRHKGVWVLVDPAFRSCNGTARMAVPNLLRDEVDETCPLENSALATRLPAEEAVDAADT